MVNHRAAKYGRSKYGIGRTVRVILDLLTVKFLLSYSTRPLQIFGLIGGGMALPGLLISGWLASGAWSARCRWPTSRCCSWGSC